VRERERESERERERNGVCFQIDYFDPLIALGREIRDKGGLGLGFGLKLRIDDWGY
jgi:hypothetical protein